MWIFACGMFRSGSTLQFQLLSAMIERAGLGRRTPWADPESFGELAPPLDGAPEMLVFKTHICKHPMRTRLAEGRAKAIGSHRDPRDVAVSGAHKAGVEPTPDYCRELMTGLMAVAHGWSRSEVFELSYASLTERTSESCLRMAAYLGVPLSPAEAAELAEQHSPDHQRRRIEHAIASGDMRPARPGGKLRHTSRELLHPNHLADGATGKWRSELSDEAVEIIESIAGEWMVARGYELTTGEIAA